MEQPEIGTDSNVEDQVPPSKADDAPESAPRFKAGDVARRHVGGQEVVIRKSVPPSAEGRRAHIEEGAPPPPFEYECYWFEGTEYKAAVVFEFELEEEANP